MDLWTDLACLKANPKVKGFRRFGKGKGAFVNVVALVESQEEFQDRVKRHVEEFDCLVDLERVQLLETRMNAEDSPEELINMRQTATLRPSDTVFGTIHIWHQEDSN
jgi:hypothetical protein